METNERHKLSDELRRLRDADGLTVRRLADLSGLTPSTVSRLETGHIDSPRPEHLQRLARALDADIEDLYSLAGYLMPEGLPELAPYLRTKYGMPEQAVAQLDEYFQALRDRWITTNAREEGSHARGDHHRP